MTEMDGGALAQLRAAAEAAGGTDIPDGELIRFYEAKNRDLKAASLALQKTIAWRNAIDQTVPSAAEEFDMRLSSCVQLIGSDGSGCPVYCLQPGALLSDQTDGDLPAPLLTRAVRLGLEALRFELQATGADANGLILLLDLRSVRLGFWLLAMLPALREQMKIFEQHYPLCLRMVLVDCTSNADQEQSEPSLLKQVVKPWMLFRPLLSESLQARCVVVDEAHELLPVLDAHIPTLDLASPTAARAVRLRLQWLLSGGRRKPRSHLLERGILRPWEEADDPSFAGVGASEAKSVATLRAMLDEISAPASPALSPLALAKRGTPPASPPWTPPLRPTRPSGEGGDAASTSSPSQPPAAHHLPPIEFVWWLRHADGDVVKAADLMRAALRWRATNRIDEILNAPLLPTSGDVGGVEPTGGSAQSGGDDDDGEARGLVEVLRSSFECRGVDLNGQPFFVFTAPPFELEAAINVLGVDYLRTFGYRCFEAIRVALLDDSYQHEAPRQNVTLLLDLGAWADQIRPSSPILPKLLQLLKSLLSTWSSHYPHKVHPCVVTRLPTLSALWGFVRPLVSESLRSKLLLVADADLLATLTQIVPLDAVPLHLRKRALDAQLQSRPTSEVLARRGLLADGPSAAASSSKRGGTSSISALADAAKLQMSLLQERMGWKRAAGGAAAETVTAASSRVVARAVSAASRNGPTTAADEASLQLMQPPARSTLPPPPDAESRASETPVAAMHALDCIGPRLISTFGSVLLLAVTLSYYAGIYGYSILWLAAVWYLAAESHRLSLRQLAHRLSIFSARQTHTHAPTAEEMMLEMAIDEPVAPAAATAAVPGPPERDWLPEPPYAFHSEAGTSTQEEQPSSEAINAPQPASGGAGWSASGVDVAYDYQQPEWFNEIWRRVWRLAGPDFSRRLQRLIDKAIEKELAANGFGKVKARIHVGNLPFTFNKIKIDGSDPAHVRCDADMVWRGGGSLELNLSTKYVNVPIELADMSLCGRVRLQTHPQHYAPYFGHCSISFLHPPLIDFTLRALKSFDVMEVPLLAQRLTKVLREQACKPMVWPRQAFFYWSDVIDSPVPNRVQVKLVALHPPRRHTRSNPSSWVHLKVSLSEKQYDLHYTTAEMCVGGRRVTADAAVDEDNGDAISIGEEPTLLLEAPHLCPRLRLELRERRSASHQQQQ